MICCLKPLTPTILLYAHCSFGYNMYLERHCISNLKLDNYNRVCRQRSIYDLFISQEHCALCYNGSRAVAVRLTRTYFLVLPGQLIYLKEADVQKKRRLYLFVFSCINAIFYLLFLLSLLWTLVFSIK